MTATKETLNGSTTTTAEPIAVLMARVLADIPAVGKDSQAPANMGGYSFRGIEDVLAAVKPALARHGVFCVPHTRERLTSERPVGQNKTMFVVDLWVEWTFHGPAGDSLKADAWGCGTDMGDKATQKAMTSAFKSMLLQTFAIGDAASDSERHTVPETERPNADPEAWFKDNGWASKAEHDEWRTETLASIKTLDDEARAKVKAWQESNGLDWKRAINQELAAALDLYLDFLVTDARQAPPIHDPQNAGRKCDGCEQPITPEGNCSCPF